MRTAIWLFLVSISLSAPAAGQTVPVRSGEHDGFSRLVLAFAELPDWDLGRVGDGYRLRLSDPGPQYDLSDVFRLIPRSRIRDVTQDVQSGTLTIALGCPCHADVFTHRGSNLVIDIRDGPAPLDSPFEASADTAELNGATFLAPPSVEPAPWVRYGLDRDLAEPRAATPLALSSPWTESSPPNVTDAVDPPRRPEPDTVDLARPDADAPPRVLVSPGDALAEALARAAAQGLVEANLQSGALGGVDTLHRRAHRRDGPVASSSSDGGATPRRGANIRVQTGIDRDLAGIVPGLRARLGDGVCLDRSRVNVADWGNPDNPMQDLGRLRGALAAARDTPEPQAVRALARHYLYLSFGWETLALLTAYPGMVDDAPILGAVALLIEGERLPTPHPFQGQAGCPGPAALWGLLAEGDAETGVATPSVLAAYSALPLHLRRHLGQRVSSRLLALGDTASAAAVLNAVGRAPGDHGDAVALADALVGLALDPEADTVRTALEPLVGGDTLVAAEATILLLEEALEQSGPVSGDLVETAGAFAFELAGHPVATQLRIVEARALSRNGAHRAALLALDRADTDGLLDAAVLSALRIEAYRAAVASATDDEIGLLALSARDTLGFDDPARAVRRAIAERLIALGLTDFARSLLPPIETRAQDDRLLVAQTYLVDDDAAAAANEVAGLSGEGIAPIRAEILSARGRHDRAAEVFEALDALDRSLQEAVLSRSWSEIARVAPPTLSDAVQFLADRPGQLPPPEPGSGALLLFEAEAARAGLEALLAATALPQ